MDRRTSQIKILLFLVFLSHSTVFFGQNDHINWSSFQLQKKLSEKTTVNVKPIFRFNEDMSNFEDMSVDVFASYKLGKGWTAQLASRTWFIPDQKPRQFIWPEVSYGFSKGSLKIDNRLRYHLALDINDRQDSDFLRWSIRFMYNKGNIKPFLAFEPWLRLDGIEKIQRVRYMPGVSWKLNDTYSISFTYWKQESVNIEPKENTNFWLLNLLVKI